MALLKFHYRISCLNSWIRQDRLFTKKNSKYMFKWHKSADAYGQTEPIENYYLKNWKANDFVEKEFIIIFIVISEKLDIVIYFNWDIINLYFIERKNLLSYDLCTWAFQKRQTNNRQLLWNMIFINQFNFISSLNCAFWNYYFSQVFFYCKVSMKLREV